MTDIRPHTFGGIRQPCFLLAPLGWVLDQFADAVETPDPRLLGALVGLTQSRMHLLALTLAHAPGGVSTEIMVFLVQGRRSAVLEFSLGFQPVGLGRVLRHLPSTVLPAESYRNLVDLLGNQAAAKFLHHQAAITEGMITALHRLPAVLSRPPIMKLFTRIDRMDTFVDGLRLLADRMALPFETIAADLGTLHQPDQIVAKIRQLVDSISLPANLPPPLIGAFRRVDSVDEIRTLATAWHNCLAEYLYQINNGMAALYLAEAQKVACLVSRCGRLGWCLADAKGPHNAAVAPTSLAEIYACFANASIPHTSCLGALKAILAAPAWVDPFFDADEIPHLR